MTNMKNTKRALVSSVLALFLCFAMLLGTTYAWFTDEVSSEGNIIQTGTLDVIMEYADGTDAPDADTTTWNDAAKGKIFNYDNWEPGYVDAKHIKISNVGSLALNYYLRVTADSEVSMLADVIDVYYFETATQLTRDAVETGTKLGTLADIMGTELNISNTVKGMLAPEGVRTLTLALKMQESAGNEYQNLSIGVDGFAVQLIATQASKEEDAFGTDYDEKVPDPGIPSALVRPLENTQISYTTTFPNGTPVDGGAKLDVAYQFEPTMTYEQAQQSQYRYWHADFVVSADKDVPTDSMMLAGYYSAFCKDYNNDNWVGLIADQDIAAGTEIRLVSNMAGGYYVNWEEICNFGNDGKGFQCGLLAIDKEALAGTTVTVELRIYETTKAWDAEGGTANEEVGPDAYITVGTFTYTVPAYKVNNQEELNAAIEDGITSISLASGTYAIPDSAKGKTLELIGNGDVVINVEDDGAAEGDIDYSLDGSTVTFTNLTLNILGNDHPGYARMSATYNNCTIVGSNYCLYGDSVFNNCTFNLNNGYVWTWGAENVEFNNCTFEAVDGSAKAILVHNTVETNIKVKDCTFIATTTKTTWDGIPVAAVSIDPENGSPDATVSFEGTNTYSNAFHGLYQVKYADELDDVKVYVDGTLDANVPVGENDK
ncbi:MAG: hypothetical protein IJW70_04655 [Clostridia bacterium]|nr:hypothetical protein [Clostridia bacterium]